jgi:hypothetical protein
MMAATALTLLATAPQPLALVELFLKKVQKTTSPILVVINMHNGGCRDTVVRIHKAPLSSCRFGVSNVGGKEGVIAIARGAICVGNLELPRKLDMYDLYM